jgi:hypothetical protein
MGSSTLNGILETLIGPFTGGGGAQIALRFPGDNTGPNFEIYPDFMNHWHIDGLSVPNSTLNGVPVGDIHNFTALVGVLLQDVPAENMGNLVVYPGSHYELQNHFRTVGFHDALQIGTQALPKIKFSRPPIQICGKAGDVVIVNYLVAHLVAPNVSSSIRYCTYFRLKASSFARNNSSGLQHRPQSMLDAWCDWPGLEKARRSRDRKKKEEEQYRQAIAASISATAVHSSEDDDFIKAIEKSKREF